MQKLNITERLKQIGGKDVFSVQTRTDVNGNTEKTVKIWGYFYDGEEPCDGTPEQTWRDVEFCGLEMNIDEFDPSMIDDYESAAKTYIGDVSPEEALDAFVSYFHDGPPVPLSLASVGKDTPDGCYYDGDGDPWWENPSR